MRPIETDSFVKVDANGPLGPAPQLQWIKIVDLVVDEAYQRPLTSQGSRTNVRRIADTFDWRRFAPVIVSPVEGGRYAIVDGQHRTTAAALRGIEQVPCNVVLADRQEQAQAFQAINDQVTRVTRQHIFKAKLAAGDDKARRLAELADGAGIEIMTYNPSRKFLKPNQTTAIDRLYRLLDEFGDDILRRSLKALMVSADGHAGALRAVIMQAVVEVLADHQEWLDDPRLSAVMRDFDVITEEENARSRAIKVKGTTTLNNLQAALITFLNDKLPDATKRIAAE